MNHEPEIWSDYNHGSPAGIGLAAIMVEKGSWMLVVHPITECLSGLDTNKPYEVGYKSRVSNLRKTGLPFGLIGVQGSSLCFMEECSVTKNNNLGSNKGVNYPCLKAGASSP